MGDDPTRPPADDMGDRILAQLMEIWVKPEIRRRQEAAAAPKPLQLSLAQVILRSKGPAEVRLNEEVRLRARATVGRPISPGDAIALNELTNIDAIEPSDDDIDAGHITLILQPGKALLFFDTRYNAGTIASLLRNADEFLQTARAALADGRERAFAENLFTAVELMAKGALIALPVPHVEKSRTHRTVRNEFNRRRDFADAPGSHVDLLNQLAQLRERARFSTEPFALDKQAANAMLATADEMRELIERRRPRRQLSERV